MDLVTEAMRRFWFRLACVLEEGQPLLPALIAAADECAAPQASAAFTAVAEMVADGSPLSDALASQPAFFGPGAICIIRGGEHLGMIARAVRFVADASAGCPSCAAWRGNPENDPR